jgi:hypothetical protein
MIKVFIHAINIIVPMAIVGAFQLALYIYAVRDHRKMVKKFNDSHPQAGPARYSKEVDRLLELDKDNFSQ